MTGFTMHHARQIDEALETVQRNALGYFLNRTSPTTGLVADNTREDSHASIAATGLGLAAASAAVERGLVERGDAVKRILTTLRFFRDSPQSEEPNATGYKGFYYHFLDMKHGRRAWQCELSVIDTALLMAGVLTVAMYFDGDDNQEQELRKLAGTLYQRVDWMWAMNNGPTLSHGWKPDSGFLRYTWDGYSEALLLYVLALGSPSHPIPPQSYHAWTSAYQWENLYGYDFLFAATLFIHQLSHVWIDFRGIQDEFMREKRCDYFENSRRATYIQREYAIRNPKRFKGYNKNCWGITASDGPGEVKQTVDEVERQFFGYAARGIPYGPDDGTMAPWAVLGSLPFAPEIVFPAWRHCQEEYPEILSDDGYLSTFNPSFDTGTRAKPGWVCPAQYGLDQGPVVLMIENYRSELLWRLMRKCPVIISGLRRAGFTNGWLDKA